MHSRGLPILFLSIALAILVPACARKDISLFDLGYGAGALKPRVIPGGVLDVKVTARNTGQALWEPDEVRLVFAGDASWKNAALALTASSSPGKTGTFTGKLVAPPRPGIHTLKWQADYEREPFGLPILAHVEVTCSDSVFCNGAERFVEGSCTSGSDPCDDGQGCTQDSCNESAGTCDRTLGASCASCLPPCAPDCTGKLCGDDGCGGSCGRCATGEGCASAPGMCQPAIAPGTCANPLLLAVIAGVGGTGTRRIMRFSVEAINQGQATLHVPRPVDRPDLFTYSLCHRHYHFSGFASYALIGLSGETVLVGRKQAYCVVDAQQAVPGPQVSCAAKYDCATQGIQAGWSDLYGNTLDCQWLDITDVAPGDYSLEVVLNPDRTFEEVSFDNNTAAVPVKIPVPVP
jgi:hypothetical protein